MSTANSVTKNELVAEAAEQPTVGGMIFSAIGTFALGAWFFYDLLRLENGDVESVRVWAPMAMLYETLGFWPAVLLLPAIGLFITYKATSMLVANMGISASPEMAPNSITGPQNDGLHEPTAIDDGGPSWQSI
jgi:hypothetical protein